MSALSRYTTAADDDEELDPLELDADTAPTPEEHRAALDALANPPPQTPPQTPDDALEPVALPPAQRGTGGSGPTGSGPVVAMKPQPGPAPRGYGPGADTEALYRAQGRDRMAGFTDALSSALTRRPMGGAHHEEADRVAGLQQATDRNEALQGRRRASEINAERADPASPSSKEAQDFVRSVHPEMATEMGPYLDRMSYATLTAQMPYLRDMMKAKGARAQAAAKLEAEAAAKGRDEEFKRGEGSANRAARIEAARISAQQPKFGTIAPGGQVYNSKTGDLGSVSDVPKPVSPAAKNADRTYASSLRNEFEKLPDVKSFKEVATALGKVRAAATGLAPGAEPSAAADMSLIFAYMKMLDPGSTVREGEYASAQNTTGAAGKLSNLYNNALSGARLNPQQRREFTAEADKLFGVHKTAHDKAATQYRALAEKNGVDPLDVVGGAEEGGKRTAPLVTVSNGAETMQIPAADLADAERDGFKAVP